MVVLREEDGAPCLLCGDGAGQDAGDGADVAGETEFAVAFVGQVGGDLGGGGEDAQRDGEVVARAFFGQVGGGEVDGDAFGGEVEAAVQDGCAYAVFGFFDGFFRQADEGHGG